MNLDSLCYEKNYGFRSSVECEFVFLNIQFVVFPTVINSVACYFLNTTSFKMIRSLKQLLQYFCN